MDFSGAALTAEQASRAFDQIIESGTTYFLPTVITSAVSTYEHVLPILAGLVSRS